MKRRSLDFESFDALRAELGRLRPAQYAQAGAWSLGQNCEHIAMMMDQSIDGFEAKLPWIIRLGAPVAMWWIFRTRRMPTGVKAPPSFRPPESIDDQAGVQHLLDAIDRYVNHSGPMQPSPLFGAIRRDQWDKIHLIHAAHHLSFIVPTDATGAANRAGA